MSKKIELSKDDLGWILSGLHEYLARQGYEILDDPQDITHIERLLERLTVTYNRMEET